MKIDKEKLLARVSNLYDDPLRVQGNLTTSVWRAYQEAMRDKKYNWLWIAAIILLNGSMVFYLIDMLTPAKTDWRQWLITVIFSTPISILVAIINHHIVAQTQKYESLERLVRQHNDAIDRVVDIINKTH